MEELEPSESAERANAFIDDLMDVTMREEEQAFMQNYIGECLELDDFWNCPALLPRPCLEHKVDRKVWSDFEDEYVSVSFVYGDPASSNGLGLIDILQSEDGVVEAEKYKKQAAKRRRLTRRGWDFIELLDSEVWSFEDEHESFSSFYSKVTGSHIRPGGLPFQDPTP